jgi:hypothetical protein
MIDRSLGLHVEKKRKTRREVRVGMNGIQGSTDDKNRNRSINGMFGGSSKLDHESMRSATSTNVALSIGSAIGHYTSSQLISQPASNMT